MHGADRTLLGLIASGAIEAFQGACWTIGTSVTSKLGSFFSGKTSKIENANLTLESPQPTQVMFIVDACDTQTCYTAENIRVQVKIWLLRKGIHFSNIQVEDPGHGEFLVTVTSR